MQHPLEYSKQKHQKEKKKKTRPAKYDILLKEKLKKLNDKYSLNNKDMDQIEIQTKVLEKLIKEKELELELIIKGPELDICDVK